MQPTVAERRLQDRLNLTLRVFERETGEFLGATENIHCGGMMLISKRPFSNGEAVKIVVELPDKHETRKLGFTAKSCWSSPDEDPSLHNIGFQFLHSSPQMKSFYETLFDGLEI